MASSNRHWPSMFRSNPAAACDFNHQTAGMNNSSGSSFLGAGRPSLLSSGIEESGRSPEPKPRWNPRPEQIRILEGIFNSGVVNPPRDEIRRIRMQLQEYGQVGDANVFYWFQNRKSRTKNKLRAAAGQLQSGRGALARASTTRAAPPHQAQAPPPASPVTPPRHLLSSPLAPTSSSSSSSDRSSGSSKSVKVPAMLNSATAVASQGMLPLSTGMDLFTPTPSPAPVMSGCQLYYHHPMPTMGRELLAFPEPAPLLPQWSAPQSQYLPATELGGILGYNAHTAPTTHPSGVSPGVLLSPHNDVLGQQDMTDTYMTTAACSISKQALGQYVLDAAAASSSSISDAVSAVIRENDETASLSLLHYGCFDFTAAHESVTTATVDDFSTAASINAASSALTDQLQDLLDAGLIGAGAQPQPPTATVVALPLQAARAPALSASAAAQCYSIPAMTHLDVKLFGDAAVLLRHNGDHVLVDHSGITVEPLQQGAVYYVLVANW